MQINTAMFQGRLWKDPTVKSTQKGGKMATLNIVNNRRYQDKDGKWQDAEPVFMNAQTFHEGLVGVIEEKCSKGTEVMVVGALNSFKTDEGHTAHTIRIPPTGQLIIIPAGQKKADEAPPAAPDGAGAPAEEPAETAAE